MAPQHHPEIQRLRRQLEASRWEMHCALGDADPAAAGPSRVGPALAIRIPPVPTQAVAWALAAGATGLLLLARHTLSRPPRQTSPGGLLRGALRTLLPFAALWLLWRPSLSRPCLFS